MLSAYVVAFFIPACENYAFQTKPMYHSLKTTNSIIIKTNPTRAYKQKQCKVSTIRMVDDFNNRIVFVAIHFNSFNG